MVGWLIGMICAMSSWESSPVRDVYVVFLNLGNIFDKVYIFN